MLAALVGGYAVAYAVTASRGLSTLARPDRVVFSSLASFAVWAAVVIYVRRAQRRPHLAADHRRYRGAVPGRVPFRRLEVRP